MLEALEVIHNIESYLGYFVPDEVFDDVCDYINEEQCDDVVYISELFDLIK